MGGKYKNGYYTKPAKHDEPFRPTQHGKTGINSTFSNARYMSDPMRVVKRQRRKSNN